jgi:hypothetical protein
MPIGAVEAASRIFSMSSRAHAPAQLQEFKILVIAEGKLGQIAKVLRGQLGHLERFGGADRHALPAHDAVARSIFNRRRLFVNHLQAGFGADIRTDTVSHAGLQIDHM